MSETDSNSIEPQYADSTTDSSSDAVQMLQQAMDARSVDSEVAPEGSEQQEIEPKPEVEAAPKQDERFAAKFAALSRREKQIRQRETQLQSQMEALQQRLAQIESQAKEVDVMRDLPNRLKREPLKVLEESGLKFEQLAEMVLNDGKPTQEHLMSEYEKKFTAKMQELENKLAEKEAKEQQERVEAALSQFQAQLTDFINVTPDYELIKANDSVDLVFQVIEEHHSETGEILSNKEACDAVENYLLEEAKKLVDREKVKKLLQPQQVSKKPSPPSTAAKTLSNAQAAQAPKSAAKQLSNEESKAQAAKLLRWED